MNKRPPMWIEDKTTVRSKEEVAQIYKDINKRVAARVKEMQKGR